MSDPLIRELDHYVVLEPGAPQQLLTAEETLAWLKRQLHSLEAIPEDLSGLGSTTDQAQRLLETACELELQPGITVQWFAIRLEPPGASS